MTEHEKKSGSAETPDIPEIQENADVTQAPAGQDTPSADVNRKKKSGGRNSPEKPAAEKPAAEEPVTEKPAAAKNTVRESVQADADDKQRTGFVRSAIALALIVLIGGGVWYATQNGSNAFAQKLEKENAELKTQLAQLQHDQQQSQQQLREFMTQQSALTAQLSQQDTALKHDLDILRSRVSALSSADVKSWLIAQADFLVKMAERKLWNDQDVITAMVLLKNADASLAEMNDPGLLDVRTALRNDIASLSTMSQIDSDGIILRINQLANQVDNLRFDDGSRDGAPMDSDDGEGLSSSVADWRINLSRSWKSFTDDFITIRRRDSSAAPLLAPNQDIYVRENIRAQLLIAAQAVPRHQEASYKQSLDAVSTWTRAYFSDNDPANTAFLKEIDDLAAQPISMNIPDALTSQPLLDKLVQTRIRRLLNDESPAAVPAPAPAAQPAAAPVTPAEPAAAPQAAETAPQQEG